jgi:hypothetical protein
LCGLSKDELGLAQLHDVSLDLPPAGHRSNTMSVSCSGNKSRPAKRRKTVFLKESMYGSKNDFGSVFFFCLTIRFLNQNNSPGHAGYCK